MNCEYCELEKGRSKILYQDEQVIAVVKDTGVHPGQITIFPKEHFTILEMVPEDILQKCFILANKVGIAVFEGLDAQGTNIIIQNGLSAGQKVPHFGIEVIPRREQDGLNFQWATKQLQEDELDGTFKMLKEGEKKEEKKEEKVEKKEEVKIEKKSESKEEENYMLKQLRRIP